MEMKNVLVYILNACVAKVINHEMFFIPSMRSPHVWLNILEEFRQNSTIVVRDILHPLLRKAIAEQREWF